MLLRDRSPGPADRVRPRLRLYGAGGTRGPASPALARNGLREIAARQLKIGAPIHRNIRKAANVLCRVVRAPRTTHDGPRIYKLSEKVVLFTWLTTATLKARRELPKDASMDNSQQREKILNHPKPLSPNQRRAVLSDKRHIRIIAGAWAGKTETLTR